MKIRLLNRFFISFLIFMVSAAALSAEQIDIMKLVKNALLVNSDIIASGYDVSAERQNFESALAGVLPSLGFTTDTGNNPLYKYSNANEFSTTSFTTERYQRHKVGGGVSLGLDMPTGGSLSITGAGSFGLALAEGADDWNYIVNPAVSMYLRQPLFTDRLGGSPLRVDSLELGGELAGISLMQAELNKSAIENNIIISVVRTAIIFNNLVKTNEILNKRLKLSQSRLELAYQDEQAGNLSRLDRLAEELQIRRQQEALVEFDFQIESAARTLENLTGISGFSGKRIVLPLSLGPGVIEVSPDNSSNVLFSEAIRRSLEIAGTIIQNGNEPVLEISGLLRRSDQDSADTIETAFNEGFSSEMDLSVSLAISISALDWGESNKKIEAEKAALEAAEQRLFSAKAVARLQITDALEKLQLIEEKFLLLKSGLDYDNSLLEREIVRLDAGLTSILAVETVKLDKQEREYQIEQLLDEKILAVLELYNTGGIELKNLF